MKRLLIAASLVCLSFSLIAQKRKLEKDPFKRFVSISHGYKYLPLQLKVDYEQFDNFAPESKKMTGEFYMTAHNAYIKFGSYEQILSDSSVLMVLDDVKHMRLTRASVNIGEQLKLTGSPMLRDTTLKSLNLHYEVKENKETGDAGTSSISLVSKAVLYSTDIPIYELELTYNPTSGEPLQVITLKKSLVPKSALSKLNAGQGIKEVTIEGKGQFLVREEKAVFSYLQIAHKEADATPVQLQDRLIKDDNGNYSPTGTYRQYTLIQ